MNVFMLAMFVIFLLQYEITESLKLTILVLGEVVYD